MATKSHNYGIIHLDYRRYVLPLEDATMVAGLLATAEVYTVDYVKDPTTGEHVTTHRISDMATKSDLFEVKVLPLPLYKMYKLADQ